jgi:Domain of unknown function (DUF4926)
MNDNFYLKSVIYIGPEDLTNKIAPGDLGVVVECFSDENYYVEFSNADGTTKSLVVLQKKYLNLSEENEN